MKDKVMDALQRFSKAMFIPVLILPIAGILIAVGNLFTNVRLQAVLPFLNNPVTIGFGTLLSGSLNAILGNLGVIFCVGLSVGLANKKKSEAGFISLLAFLVFLNAMNKFMNMRGMLVEGSLSGTEWIASPYNVHDFSVAEATVALRYAPGETFVNTKQRRLPVNLDAPVFTLQHTLGLKGVLGSDYTYNMTEVGLYKRFWMSSWGNIDAHLKGGIQWNKVPFPLLIMPAANLSYIIQEETFSLINNMEFLNDRYASLDVSWNMQGKLFNRIPLLKKLKWREFIGVKCLWGQLTDKNNPFLAQNANDPDLMLFPGHYDAAGVYHTSSYVMDPKKPYVEISAGIHNIFKLLHVEYVRRLNYNELPTANKWGIRFMIRTVF